MISDGDQYIRNQLQMESDEISWQTLWFELNDHRFFWFSSQWFKVNIVLHLINTTFEPVSLFSKNINQITESSCALNFAQENVKFLFFIPDEAVW